MKFFQLDPRAILPTRSTTGASGYDIYAMESGFIFPGVRLLVRTGFGIILPSNEWSAKIEERSGLATKNGIVVRAGRIDADYQGEVQILLHNVSDRKFEWIAGDRLAQMIVQRIFVGEPMWSDKPLTVTDRGAGGFGSTGV